MHVMMFNHVCGGPKQVNCIFCYEHNWFSLSAVLITTIVSCIQCMYSTYMKQMSYAHFSISAKSTQLGFKPQCSISLEACFSPQQRPSVYILKLWHWLSCWSTFNGAEFDCRCYVGRTKSSYYSFGVPSRHI